MPLVLRFSHKLSLTRDMEEYTSSYNMLKIVLSLSLFHSVKWRRWHDEMTQTTAPFDADYIMNVWETDAADEVSANLLHTDVLMFNFFNPNIIHKKNDEKLWFQTLFNRIKRLQQA